MNNIVEDLRNSISSYKFADIKKALSDFEVNKDGIALGFVLILLPQMMIV